MTRACTQEKNIRSCTCTYPTCSRKGICCECIAYHRAHRELPACVFPKDVERTYDRSFEAFIRAWSR
ncbi:MAG: DUF6485 family protein [Thermoplasmatota archaeon]